VESGVVPHEERLDLLVGEFGARCGLTLEVPRLRTNPLSPEQKASQVTDRISAPV